MLFRRSKEAQFAADCEAFVSLQNDKRIGEIARLMALGWTGREIDSASFEAGTAVLAAVAEDHSASPYAIWMALRDNEPILAGEVVTGECDPPESI